MAVVGDNFEDDDCCRCCVVVAAAAARMRAMCLVALRLDKERQRRGSTPCAVMVWAQAMQGHEEGRDCPLQPQMGEGAGERGREAGRADSERMVITKGTMAETGADKDPCLAMSKDANGLAFHNYKKRLSAAIASQPVYITHLHMAERTGWEKGSRGGEARVLLPSISATSTEQTRAHSPSSQPSTAATR